MIEIRESDPMKSCLDSNFVDGVVAEVEVVAVVRTSPLCNLFLKLSGEGDKVTRFRD